MAIGRWTALALTVLLILPASNTLAGFGAASTGCQVPARNGDSRSRGALDLEVFFRAQVTDFNLAGIGAGIVKEGKVAWTGGFGQADIEIKRPVSADTIFNVGSVSKTVTLAAFSIPEESRDSKTQAEQALKEFLVPGGKYYSDKNYLESAPGERYAYSNSSYSLIGCVIERLGGRPFWQYCRENIFVPLGMNDSSWRLADLGRGFVSVLSEIKGRRIFHMNGFGPAFFAQVYFDPARKIGGAFFTTGGFDSFQALGNAVQLFFDEMLETTNRL